MILFFWKIEELSEIHQAPSIWISPFIDKMVHKEFAKEGAKLERGELIFKHCQRNTFTFQDSMSRYNIVKLIRH